MGAGPGPPTSETTRPLGDLRSLRVGLDVNPAIRSNAYLDSKVIGAAEDLPFASETFDIVFADYVMEHMANPGSVVAEVWRVLKPGGCFLFRTNNLRHYATIATIAASPSIRERFLSKLTAKPGHTLHSVVYRFNSKRVISETLTQAGFTKWELHYVEKEPMYLAASWPILFIGIFYERLVNKLAVLQPLRANIFGTCYK